MLHLKRVLRRSILDYTRSGHSLIEICCVLALISILGIISLQSFYRYQPFVVRMELTKLHAALVYVRRKALLERTTQRIYFDGKAMSYRVDTMVHRLPSQVRFGIVKGVKGPPGDPRRPLEKAITWRHETLEVYTDGTVSSGAVYLTDESRSCLYALTSDASAITGVRRYCYKSSWELIQ